DYPEVPDRTTSQHTPPLVSRHAPVVRSCTDCGKTKPPTAPTHRSKARATATHGASRAAWLVLGDSFRHIHRPLLSRSCIPGASLGRNQSFRQVCASAPSAVGRKKWLSSHPLLSPNPVITVAVAHAARGWRGSGTTRDDATKTAHGGRQTASRNGPRQDRYPQCGLAPNAAWPRSWLSSLRSSGAPRAGNGRCRVCRARRARERYWADPDECE